MRRYSFIHCGDIHLGCQQFNDPNRFEDFFEAFSHIVEYAVDKHAGYILVAGDLFHHRNVNAQTLGMAIAQLEKMKTAGIMVIAIEGNHDKAFYVDEDSWMNFLNRQGYLKLLKPEFHEGKIKLGIYDGEKGCVLEEDGLRIIGLGYLGATTAQRLQETAEQLIQFDFDEERPLTVLMLHAAVDKLMGQDMAGVGRDCFKAFAGKADYIALGHIHSRQEQTQWIYNPGAPESVHIDEVRRNQEKGFYHVTVEGREMQVDYIQSRRRPVRYLDVDLTSIPTPAHALGVVTDRLESSGILGGLGEVQPILQVNLFGTVDFNSFAIEEGIMSDTLKSRFNCLAVEVLNNVNLERTAEASEDGGFDRSSVERHVIMKMIEEEKPEYRDVAHTMADLVLRAKNLSLSGVDEDEIIDMIGKAIEGLESCAKEEMS